ncbi:hypothetical protein L1049_014469 [Liquidambar formosana]|uniref:Uncharacterized protein n=1 Tax=Liquidambar formosana TaxID=63359 RepID=A0AAP0WZ14_LIQFO
MGVCASSQITRQSGSTDWPHTAKIIHLDGRLQEFKQPIKTRHILSQNPNSFLCSSECMYVDCHVPHVPEDEELQLGQLYFLMPISQSHTSLSLQDLCALAIKASAALSRSDAKKTSAFLDKNGVKFPTGIQECFQTPTGFSATGGMKSQVGRGNQRIEF